MRKIPAIAALVFLSVISYPVAFAQEPLAFDVRGLNQIIPGAPVGVMDYVGDTVTGTNGICVSYGGTVLMADSVSVNRDTGEAVADGHVRIEQQGGQIWIGEHITYNFKTRQMHSDQFRTGKPPVFAAGNELQGDVSNQTYTARHVFVTTDDISNPAIRVRVCSGLSPIKP